MCRIKHRQATGHVEARGINRTSKASRDWLGISRILKRPSKMQVGPRTRRNLRALESFDFECSAADRIQSYVPAASLRIAADDIDKVNRTRYREGRPQGRLSYFQPPASAWPFRSQEAPLRSIQAPANMGYRCYSNLRKAPSCSRLPALVPSLRNIRSITSTLAAFVAPNVACTNGGKVGPAYLGSPCNGTVGSGTIQGPGAWNVDVALSRNIVVPVQQDHAMTFAIRVEAFNVFNHTRLAPPDTSMSSATFGQILFANSPRIMQLALKVTF